MFKVKQWLSIAVVAIAPWSARADVPANLGQRLADGYARPSMAKLAEQAGLLEQALTTWCQSGGQSDGKHVQQAFAGTVQAWAGVEFLRFGPLVQGNRYEKLAFWPDTRGVMQRQVRAILAAADPAVVAPGALASRSVATQGLPALEYVLYGTPGLVVSAPGKDTSYACSYAVAVAGNIANVSTELKQAWSAEGEFGRQFTQPSADSDLYRSQQEVAAEAVKALSTGLQFARDVKLLPVLGESMKAARKQRAAFWRSGQTVPALAASINGMVAFYEAGDYHYSEDESWIGSSLTDELHRAAQALESLNQPLTSLLEDEAGWRRLSLAGLILKNAKDIVDQHVAPALGVTIGFNALDGD